MTIVSKNEMPDFPSESHAREPKRKAKRDSKIGDAKVTPAETATTEIIEIETFEMAGAAEIFESEPQIDAADIVEQAEALLREGAPHDFDVLVIGGGPGGYVAAIRAAQLGAHVGLVEEREIGGVCLNRGCVPTKSLLEAADMLRLVRCANVYGIAAPGEVRPDFAQINRRKSELIAQMRTRVSQMLRENDVEVLQGRARFVDTHTVEISSTRNAETRGEKTAEATAETHGETRRVSAIHIVIASGSVPKRLPIEGADLPGVFTADELVSGDFEAQNVVVVGGGAVGVEFAYLFQTMGAQAVLLEAAPAILPQEEEEVAREMARVIGEFGVQIRTEAKIERIERAPDDMLRVTYLHAGATHISSTRCVLMATGRIANTQHLDLDAVGIANENGRIQVDEKCETSLSGVYAIGDCTRNVGWAHRASGEGALVAEIITKNPISVDLRFLPNYYYTNPEIASVGRTKKEAESDGVTVKLGVFPYRANGRVAGAGQHEGFVKIVADADDERVLGCQIMGPHATELINQAVNALRNGQTLTEMVSALRTQPIFSEAVAEAALSARRDSND